MITATDLHTDSRVRSNYSDENQYILDRLAVDVFLEMGLITHKNNTMHLIQNKPLRSYKLFLN